MANNTLTITDNRTGKSYEIPIEHDTIHATDLRKIKVHDGDFGMMTYDPAFMNTASCKSTITYIDGDKGILRYRGYPIEDLAESCTYLEVAHLLFREELPTQIQLDEWTKQVQHHSLIHQNIVNIIDSFRYDAHPMTILISTISALASFFPEANNIFDAEVRKRQIRRLIGKVPTIAAFAYRHRTGMPYVYPEDDLSFVGNIASMMFKWGSRKFFSHPVLERALNILFVLHADHEQNCSTSTMRVIGSSHVDPYSAIAGAAAALFGPLHGGANEAVIHMLDQIHDIKNVPDFIKRVKAGEGRLMGFGHRVYKNYDPRAKVIKKLAYEVFEVTGRNPKLEIALELERIALEDEYFVSRKLYPNVDFYSGLIYQAMGFPVDMFPVLFAIPRTSGWLAHWQEMLVDPDQKIARPRQIYLGHDKRTFIPMENRK
ncbi:MAG: citrate synthase [Bacteroidetes bacterium]|nr:citrate synthase [Bacteroidota bacterium]